YWEAAFPHRSPPKSQLNSPSPPSRVSSIFMIPVAGSSAHGPSQRHTHRDVFHCVHKVREEPYGFGIGYSIRIDYHVVLPWIIDRTVKEALDIAASSRICASDIVMRFLDGHASRSSNAGGAPLRGADEPHMRAERNPRRHEITSAAN